MFCDKIILLSRVKYASVGGKAATISALGFSLVNFFFGYSILIGLWTLVVGLLISIWELPILFICIPQVAVVT
jgi:hypothetical protein